MQNAQNDGNRAQPSNNSVSVPRHKDVHHRWYMYEQNVCSVTFTSEPSQSSSRCISSFKDSSALLNN